MEKEVKKEFSMSFRMGIIEAGPPLGTVLNAAKVANATILIKELNEYTKELSSYFLLQVKITIFLDNTYSFFVYEPSVSLLLRFVAWKKEILVKTSGGLKGKLIEVVLLKDLYLISYFKFGDCLEASLRSVVGTANSLNLLIVKNK